MKLVNNILLVLGSSLLVLPSTGVLAELSFTVEATQDGVPIPASEIKLEPFEPGSLGLIENHRNNTGRSSRDSRRLSRRSNPTASSSNWCGAVKHTTSSPSTSQVQLVHGEFVHPSCTKRTGHSYPQAAAAWVGIDGDAVTSALFQAGTVCKVCTPTSLPTYLLYIRSFSKKNWSMADIVYVLFLGGLV